MKSITRFTKNLHGKKCLNCERELAEEDNFCPTCGQVNDMNRLSIKQYFSEYLSGFFEFDNRFLRTVVPLLLKPGTVSKNYVNGRRVYYANPFQLYLHITILFFLIVGLFKTIDSFKPDSGSSMNILNEADRDKTTQVADSIARRVMSDVNTRELGIDSVTLSTINEGLEEASRARKNKDSARADLLSQKVVTRQLVDSIFRDTEKVQLLFDASVSKKDKDSIAGIIMRTIDKKSAQLVSDGEELIVSDWTDAVEGWQLYDKKSQLNQEAANRIGEILEERGVDYKVPARLVNRNNVELPDGALGNVMKRVKLFMDYDKANPETNELAALDDLGVEPTYWNVFFYNKARDWNEARSDPAYWKEWVDRVLSRVSVALFFLLPVFTLIVSLFYIRHRYNYTENLVFVFHVQTVFFLLLLIFIVIARLTDSEAFTWIFLLLFLFYLYKAMRNFYEQGRLKTLIKFIMLNTSFLILAAIGAVIVSFLAFLI